MSNRWVKRASRVLSALMVSWVASIAHGAEEAPLAVGVWGGGLDAEGEPIFPLFVLSNGGFQSYRLQPAVIDPKTHQNTDAVRSLDGCPYVDTATWACSPDKGFAIFADLPHITAWNCGNAAAAVSCTRTGAVGGVPARAEVDALLLQEQAAERRHGQL